MSITLKRDASGALKTPFDLEADARMAKAARERGGKPINYAAEVYNALASEKPELFWMKVRLEDAERSGKGRGLEPAERQAWESFHAAEAKAAAEPFTAGAKRGQAPAMTLESLAAQIVTDKFHGDATRYADALSMAGSMRPDLMADYLGRDEFDASNGQPPHSEPARDFTEQRREAVAGIVARLTETQLRAVLRLFVSKDLDNLVHKLADAGVSLAALDAVSAKQAKQVSPAVKVGYEGQAKDASGGY